MVATSWMGRVDRAIAAVAVVLVAGIAVAWLLRGPAPDDGRSSPGVASTASAGMPVITASEARNLLDDGALDGRAIAVAGWYFSVPMSCPAPGRYIGPLEGECHLVAFADDAAGATMCTYGENSMECHAPPSGQRLDPFFVAETSGGSPTVEREPVPLLLVGHAGDPRQWQCSTETQETCSDAFVVDRILWEDGREVPLTAPEAWDRTSSRRLVTALTVEDVAAAVGEEHEVIAAAAVEGGAVSTLDPRWNLAGDEVVWLVRSVPAAGPDDDPTRPVTVWLVDDATGAVLDSRDLASGAGYRPARLWTTATRLGHGCCADDVYPFFRVERVERAGEGAVHDGSVEGGAYGGDARTTYGPGPPLVLEAGSYAVTSWLATRLRDVVGPPTGTCTTEITLAEGDDLMLDAAFPAPGEACAFGDPTPPNLTWF